MNDCWPCTSWAIVDYFGRPKPSYFVIARELRPVTVGVARKDVKTYANDRTAAFYVIETVIEIWGTNSTLFDKRATLQVSSFDLHSEWRHQLSRKVVLRANSSCELYETRLPGQERRTSESEAQRMVVVSARLLDETGQVLARHSNWPEPFKRIKFPSARELGLELTIGADGESVHLSCKRPIKGLVFDVKGDDVRWSDQAIDLIPDDPQTVKAVGLRGREVNVRFLGDGST